MTQNTDKKPEWNTLRIDSAVMELLVDEQSRLRKLNKGKKPNYSEILRKMWQAYSEAPAPRSEEEQGIGHPVIVPPRYSDPERARLHRLLDEIWNSGNSFSIAIKNNLEMLAFAVTVGKGFSQDDIRRMLDQLANTLPQEEGGNSHATDVQKVD